MGELILEGFISSYKHLPTFLSLLQNLGHWTLTL